jgi:hypothetical protein
MSHGFGHLPVDKATYKKDFNSAPLDERIQATRGMIVDFALLSGMWSEDRDIIPAATVCTIG